MNTNPCKTCKHYDPIVGPRRKVLASGRCVARSLYPFREGPGQVFPPDAKRVDSQDKPAKIVVVRQDEVVTACTQYEPVGG